MRTLQGLLDCLRAPAAPRAERLAHLHRRQKELLRYAPMHESDDRRDFVPECFPLFLHLDMLL
jgi:hypothetical protein